MEFIHTLFSVTAIAEFIQLISLERELAAVAVIPVG